MTTMKKVGNLFSVTSFADRETLSADDPFCSVAPPEGRKMVVGARITCPELTHSKGGHLTDRRFRSLYFKENCISVLTKILNYAQSIKNKKGTKLKLVEIFRLLLSE